MCWLATSSSRLWSPDLLEEAGVLDRQDGLAGERLEQLDDGLRELAGRLAADDQHADDALLADSGTASSARKPACRSDARAPAAGRDIRASASEVRRSGRPARASAARPTSVVVGQAQPVLLDRRRAARPASGRTPGATNVPLVVVQLVDRAGVGAGEAGGVRDDGGQHLLEVERGGDGLADLAERLQLVDRAASARCAPGAPGTGGRSRWR